jgi:type III restriction enzyme
MEVIGRYETRREQAPTHSALLKPEIRQEILEQVEELLKPAQGTLLADTPAIDLPTIIARTTELVANQSIDIPRISVTPKGELSSGFHPFKLDVTGLHLQPAKREIVGQMLRTNEQFTLASETGLKEARLEDYIVHALVDYDDIDYFTQAELLYDLAGQMVNHLRSYLSEEEACDVLDRERKLIAREIHAQMLQHVWEEEAAEYEVRISRSFTALKPCNYTASVGQTAHHYRETVTDRGRIKQMLFGSFTRCLYPLQKFDSDTERRFAIILERDALKWFKPAKGQFQIYYRLGSEQPEYIPDFVVETESIILIVETKARNDLDSAEVRAKAAAATLWCQRATTHSLETGGKPWFYWLLPHDEINEAKQLDDFKRFVCQ